MEYDSGSIVGGYWNYMRIRVMLDVCLPLKKKKRLLFSLGNIGYVYFKYERLTLFCFFYGKLGHSDSFFNQRMALGVEVVEIDWDLSLRAQSRRIMAISSVWLREGERGREAKVHDGSKD